MKPMNIIFKPKNIDEIITSLIDHPDYINYNFLIEFYNKYGKEKFEQLIIYLGNMPDFYIKNLIYRISIGELIGAFSKKTIKNLLHIFKLVEIDISMLIITKINNLYTVELKKSPTT